jgi:hypothetical protein
MPPRELTDLERFLEPYPNGVQALVLEGRLLLLEMLAPVSEIFYDANSAVCSGFTHTGNVRDCFVNFAAYSDHVSLIFGFGATLNDPQGMLKGKGNQVRHIRLAGLESLQDPHVQSLILQAAETAAKPIEPIEPKITVKVMNGPKRRPSPTSV